jgi:hypothetical protein
MGDNLINMNNIEIKGLMDLNQVVRTQQKCFVSLIME